MNEVEALLKQISPGEDSNLELKEIKYTGNSINNLCCILKYFK